MDSLLAAGFPVLEDGQDNDAGPSNSDIPATDRENPLKERRGPEGGDSSDESEFADCEEFRDEDLEDARFYE